MNRRKKFAAFLAAVAVSISGLGVALPAQAAPPVSRIFGASRVETSVEIARRAFPSGAPVAYVASAQSLADALAAGSLTDGPVLLTDARALAAPVANYLASLRHAGLQKVILLGGEGVLGPQVEQAITSAGLATERLAGADRCETADLIAARAFPGGSDRVYVTDGYGADGAGSPDAVVGGMLTAGPILFGSTAKGLTPASAAVAARAHEKIQLGGRSVAGFTPTSQLAGADRFETAVKVSGASTQPKSRVYLANGLNFVDAVAGGTLTDGIMLLTRPDTIPEATCRYLMDHPEINDVVALGGPGAISDAVLKTEVAQCQWGKHPTTVNPLAVYPQVANQFTYSRTRVASGLGWGNLYSMGLLRSNGSQEFGYLGNTGQLWSHFADGRGGVTGAQMILSDLSRYPGIFTGVDWNNDTRVDVLTVDPSGTLQLRRGDGHGGLSEPETRGSGFNRFAYLFAMRNGINGAPVVVGLSSTGQVTQFPFNSDGTLGKPVELSGNFAYLYQAWPVDDLDKNGRTDLLLRDFDGWLSVILQNPNGTFSEPYRLGVSSQDLKMMAPCGAWNTHTCVYALDRGGNLWQYTIAYHGSNTGFIEAPASSPAPSAANPTPNAANPASVSGDSISGDPAFDAVLRTLAQQYPDLGSFHNYMYTHFRYLGAHHKPHPAPGFELPYGIEAWNNQGGNCYRYAAMTMWHARALGYNAQVRVGYLKARRGLGPHGWTEIIENGQRYVIDVELGQAYGKTIFYTTYAGAPVYYYDAAGQRIY